MDPPKLRICARVKSSRPDRGSTLKQVRCLWSHVYVWQSETHRSTPPYFDSQNTDLLTQINLFPHLLMANVAKGPATCYTTNARGLGRQLRLTTTFSSLTQADMALEWFVLEWECLQRYSLYISGACFKTSSRWAEFLMVVTRRTVNTWSSSRLGTRLRASEWTMMTKNMTILASKILHHRARRLYEQVFGRLSQ